jgi:hypothetical protein
MHKTMRVAATLAALTMMSVPAFAQRGGGQGGGGFGGGGFGGGGFGGGQFGRPGGGELSVVQIPVTVLTPALKLTADQSSKIKGMQDKLDAARKAMRPAGFGGGAGGGGFDREAMQQMMEEMRAKQEQLRNEETKNSKAIEAMLTPDQSAALKAAMPGWKIMQQFGLLQYAADLNLTPAQMAVLEKAAKERAALMQGGGRRGGGN